MKIEMGKEYRTRDGRPVRVLRVDFPNDELPVVALIDGQTEALGADGSYYGSNIPSKWDLIPVEAPVDLIAAERERIAAWVERNAKSVSQTRLGTGADTFAFILSALASAIRNGDYLSESVQP